MREKEKKFQRERRKNEKTVVVIRLHILKTNKEGKKRVDYMDLFTLGFFIVDVNYKSCLCYMAGYLSAHSRRFVKAVTN
jgi:hypothetical protein